MAWIDELRLPRQAQAAREHVFVTLDEVRRAETCARGTLQTLLADLRKLQEGLLAMRWIHAPVVPCEWAIDGHEVPRGAYTGQEAEAIRKRVQRGDPELAQAVSFALNSGARIDEVFHLRSDMVFPREARVERLGKGGRSRRIRVLHPGGLYELDRAHRFVFYRPGNRTTWKPALETAVRRACDILGIHRRGVHGLRGTAAAEFLRIKRDVLGLDEREARRELAQWLGHHPHRTEVTYAYVPRRQ